MIQPVPIESDRANSESDDMYLNPTSIHAALASAVREARLIGEWLEIGKVVEIGPEHRRIEPGVRPLKDRQEWRLVVGILRGLGPLGR